MCVSSLRTMCTGVRTTMRALRRTVRDVCTGMRAVYAVQTTVRLCAGRVSAVPTMSMSTMTTESANRH